MTHAALEQQTLRKVAWRLIPFICVLYLLNILDRSNIGFARLQMQEDLQLSDAASNWGYGIFYVGYLLFEVPSNLLLRKVGARRWIARGPVVTAPARIGSLFEMFAVPFNPHRHDLHTPRFLQ